MTYEALLAEFEALRDKANQAGFECIGTILTKEESALTDLVMTDDGLYDSLCNAINYASEELDVDPEGYSPVVCIVKVLS
jgi:hypothetical protein